MKLALVGLAVLSLLGAGYADEFHLTDETGEKHGPFDPLAGRAFVSDVPLVTFSEREGISQVWGLCPAGVYPEDGLSGQRAMPPPTLAVASSPHSHWATTSDPIACPPRKR